MTETNTSAVGGRELPLEDRIVNALAAREQRIADSRDAAAYRAQQGGQHSHRSTRSESHYTESRGMSVGTGIVAAAGILAVVGFIIFLMMQSWGPARTPIAFQPMSLPAQQANPNVGLNIVGGNDVCTPQGKRRIQVRPPDPSCYRLPNGNIRCPDKCV